MDYHLFKNLSLYLFVSFIISIRINCSENSSHLNNRFPISIFRSCSKIYKSCSHSYQINLNWTEIIKKQCEDYKEFNHHLSNIQNKDVEYVSHPCDLKLVQSLLMCNYCNQCTSRLREYNFDDELKITYRCLPSNSTEEEQISSVNPIILDLKFCNAIVNECLYEHFEYKSLCRGNYNLTLIWLCNPITLNLFKPDKLKDYNNSLMEMLDLKKYSENNIKFQNSTSLKSFLNKLAAFSYDFTDFKSSYNLTNSLVTLSSDWLNLKSIKKLWHDMDDKYMYASNMIISIEAAALKLIKQNKLADPISIKSSNIELHAKVVNVTQKDDLRFSDSEHSSNIFMPFKSLTHFSEKNLTYIVFGIYSGMEDLLISNNDSDCSSTKNNMTNCSKFINSKIISVSIYNMNNIKIGLIEDIRITFKLLKNKTENQQHLCVYWNTIENKWQRDGCRLIKSNETSIECSCNHLTSFAILVSPTGQQVDATNEAVLTMITIIGCSISIILLVLCIITFVVIRKLKSERNTIHINLCCSLLVSNVIFLGGINQIDIPVLCAVIAGFLDYFLLLSFAWMAIEGIEIYFKLVQVFESKNSRMVFYYLSGYMIPAIIVCLSAAVRPQGFGTETYCWLSIENGLIWAFLVPLISVILFNFLMLFVAMRTFYGQLHSKKGRVLQEKPKMLKFYSLMKALVLLVSLLGLSWIFGLLYVSQSTIIFAYLFTIINSLQGAFIFIFHCLLNKKIRKEYLKFLVLIKCLPKSYGHYSFTTQSSSQKPSETGHLNQVRNKKIEDNYAPTKNILMF